MTWEMVACERTRGLKFRCEKCCNV